MWVWMSGPNLRYSMTLGALINFVADAGAMLLPQAKFERLSPEMLSRRTKNIYWIRKRELGATRRKELTRKVSNDVRQV